ncbi:chitin synthase 1 [Syngnathus scovelli]|uniref:chitin synthase 1 n=1 Tax=Syngnathus scovelli TaxID=161590 RepID=UPI0021106B8D|nr:chitin synthase 1 [Syngnathus scovelli]XP_049574397.1 chitin synthase 1 [Syngnathus scovelli]XP_049574398.1 chitin synthase 1 [Syngnathus scovelli]XP_049574399.1 chitin synthase 1 [Syngnathus scovelli]
MEEVKIRGKSIQERLKERWDPFQLNPIGAEKEQKRRCFQLAQYLVAVIVGLAVLTSAVVAKGSLLVLTTLSGTKDKTKSKEKQFYMLMLVFCLVCPNVLVFMKSLWRCAFKSFVQPNLKTMLWICAIECIVSLGTSVLVLVVMPQFDILTNLFISGGVCILSALLQIIFRLQTEAWKIIFPICSLILTCAGYCLLGIDYYARVSSHVDRQRDDCYVYIGIGILSSLLISFCWWENPMQATNRIQDRLSELDGFRDFVFVISSLLRIIVIGAVYLFYHCLIVESIKWSDFNLKSEDWELLQIGLGLFFLQAFCSAACHWFGVVACKIHAVRMGFALPLISTGPSVLILGLILFITQANEVNETHQWDIRVFCDSLSTLNHKNITPVVFFEITKSICRTSLNSAYLQWPFSMLALEGVCMWSGLVTCTYYVWKTKVQRIERTSQLFVRRLYESAFIDLSLLLNTKMKVSRAQNQESHDNIQNCVIYLCATMWHETYDEMLKILTSMFRLDRYRGDPKEEHKDCFDFECHIYVDDAFMTEKDTGKRLVNSYVNDLTQVVIEVYRVFTNKEPDDVAIVETPYGGRLVFVMPEGNMLYFHLKDKGLIRNKKRWSQIMYMYYLLGWKGYLAKNPQTKRQDICRESLISVDGEIYLMPQHDNDNKRRFMSDDNVYVLALDGDTDFQPKAVILLVDRLRMYENVGAACGRIHPTGMGPMVWYQKFEYAVGHWLQKTAEHVFGSVLCSPGCFSLFRASALMDDNVLKRYTTTATRAGEYVQYDQGEDRWLCTLLLQQGWRVEYNAASDAYTNSPQEFKEFYNQRRRWGPSTLANTLDLLHSGGETVKRNPSISRLYIFYQMFTVGSSILGPASVTLMVAGAFQFVFDLSGTLSIVIASIPPVFYIIICFIAKANNQITIAGIMSVLYAFLMTASFFSIIGDMVMEGTFLTPTGVFLVSMTIMYSVTAILHPEECGMIIYGLMYFICIPSGYLLLTIYSLVNMHIVTWGTRESNKGGTEVKKNHNVLCDRNCRLCCWDMKFQVTQETENLMIQQITGRTGQQAAPLPITAQETNEHPALTMELKSPADANKMAQPGGNKLHIDKESVDSMEKASISSASEDGDNEDDDDYDNNNQENADLPISDWVGPVKQEFLKKLTFANLKRNLREQIRYSLRHKNYDDVCDDLILMLTDTLTAQLYGIGPEDVLTESQLEELQQELTTQARRTLKTSRMERLERKVKRAIEKTLTAPQVQKLEEDEEDFWKKLIERYLKPIVDTKAHLDEVTRELKSLRNKAVFLYFIVNVLWVVATFFLQAIGNDVISIKIPKFYSNGTQSEEYLKVEPLSLMFLLSFAILLLVQFLAMLYHRVYTLIHVVSYRSTEKDYKPKDADDEDDGLILENLNVGGLSITSDDM